jgi:hypothetical protein
MTRDGRAKAWETRRRNRAARSLPLFRRPESEAPNA